MRAMRWVLVAGLVAVACNGDDECLDDAACGPGQRCVLTNSAQEPGFCEPCDGFEIPYDGRDNDCNPSTRDVDMDGDGQNATLGGALAGDDCDDNDPAVFGGENARETCNDGKDNDCDGRIDEIDCGDFDPPVVQFLTPRNGDPLIGDATFEVAMSDDAGLTGIVLRRLDTNETIASGPLQGTATTFRATLDTTDLTDGAYVFEAEVTDVANRITKVTVEAIVDNIPSPDIVIASPPNRAGVSGEFRIFAEASDLQGVANMRVFFDGQPIATSFTGEITATATAAPADDTDTVAHFIRVEATDTEGNTGEVTHVVRPDYDGPVIEFVDPAPRQTISTPTRILIQARDDSGVRELSALGQTVFGDATTTLLELSFIANPDELTRIIEARATDATFNVNNVGNSSTAELEIRVNGLGTARFSPNGVYILGTLDSRTNVDKVVCGGPEDVFSGQADLIRGPGFAVVRPNGDLVYRTPTPGDMSGHEFLRVFEPDPLRRGINERWDLLDDPALLQNDPLIPASRCDNGVTAQAVHPLTDTVYYACNANNPYDFRVYYDENGNRTELCLFESEDLVVTISEDDYAVCGSAGAAGGGYAKRIGNRFATGSASWSFGMIRAAPGGGFWLARDPDLDDADLEFELFKWDPGRGAPFSQGMFPPLPPGYFYRIVGTSDFALDTQGNLYAFVGKTDANATFDDFVARLTIDGQFQEIFDEETGECKTHNSFFIHGP